MIRYGIPTTVLLGVFHPSTLGKPNQSPLHTILRGNALFDRRCVGMIMDLLDGNNRVKAGFVPEYYKIQLSPLSAAGAAALVGPSPTDAAPAGAPTAAAA